MAFNGLINQVKQKLSSILYNSSHCSSSCASMRQCIWDVSLVTHKEARENVKYAVLVLNRPVSHNIAFIKDFWNDATVRITVDGGTRRWDHYLSTLPQVVQDTMKLPDLVTGDFDSITPRILLKYQMKGCKTINTPDQNHTDFTKAFIELHSYCNQHNIEMDYIVAIGQSSGRLDHVLGNIQTLFLVKELKLINPRTKLYLLSDDALSWLLSPGDHVINVPEVTRNSKKSWCSLVPVGETCENITTSGLKWNLDNQPLKFGKLVSTSNTFSGSDQVKVNCSNTVLWSMRIPGLMNQ